LSVTSQVGVVEYESYEVRIIPSAVSRPNDQNPTYSLDRDVELTQLCDRMGYDEAWFGEHHSCGVEICGDPAVFVAHVAQVTRHIRLGTGVTSMPYHNPFHVAERMVLLDHLTRGRSMLGLGPGSLGTDAYMVGD